MGKLRDELSRRQVHPSQAIVLVPFAQLIQEAKQAWVASENLPANGAVFVPRFESTLNWARGLGGYTPKDGDLCLDAAFDAITARSLLQRAGLSEHIAMLAPKLLEAAWSLAGVAAAVAPERRIAWGAELAQTLLAGLSEPALSFEAAIGRLALAWCSTSAFATDHLFQAEPKLLVVIDGFQSEPLVEALALKLGSRCTRITLHHTGNGHEGVVNLHAATDFEDEAERASACVIEHLSRLPRSARPIGLVALDRELVRRVRAILSGRGVEIRDETGWKLSTTRACANLTALLRASRRNASTDDVLDWLKNAPAFLSHKVTLGSSPAVVDQLERELRKAGLRDWPTQPEHAVGLGEPSRQCVFAANLLLRRLAEGRTLIQWLGDLRGVLRDSGQWTALAADGAGRAVLEALKLATFHDAEVVDTFNAADLDARSSYGMRLAAAEFAAWAGQTLEASNYSPPHPPGAQVVILPLAQLLGRSLDAVVLAGCDETHLPASPEPPGAWTPLQRVALGLPTRAALAAVAKKSWDCALTSPRLDILWRTGESGERNMPSEFVQALAHQLKLRQQESTAQAGQGEAPLPVFAEDPRVVVALQANASHMPSPSGQALVVQRLSASAYSDLRRCPYRFFALRQLQLSEEDELEAEVDKRDFGNWLHRVLFHFQNALKEEGTADRAAQVHLINRAAQQATADLGLSAAEFLPFSAAWPRVRAGYLDWLDDHVETGHRFEQAEVWKEMRLGPVTLVGKLDRLDRQKDGKLLVMDYKTESRTLTGERIKAGNEDTQLAFYTALFDVDDIAAAYVNVGEKDHTKVFAQPDIVALRSQLAEGILEDLQGIAAGKAMPALGEGFACDYCAARGLCRKDFWSA